MKTFLIRRRHFDLSATRMVEQGSASDLEGSVTVDRAKYNDMQRHGGLVERRDREEGERD